MIAGNLDGFAHVPWIHNYPLLKLYDYGLFFSFPVLFLYFYLLVFAIKKSLKEKVTVWNFGVFALIIPFIASMAEPTLPFGPVTATVFNFIMFGVFLKYLHGLKDEDSPNL